MNLKLTLDDVMPDNEATVYGIVSELPDYRLCFMLNKELNLALQLSPHPKILYRKKISYAFNDYVYLQEQEKMEWHLTANRKSLEVNISESFNNQGKPERTYQYSQEFLPLSLVNDLKAFDYFLWFDDLSRKGIEKKINQSLKGASYVRTFQKIDLSHSKFIDNLFIEL